MKRWFRKTSQYSINKSNKNYLPNNLTNAQSLNDINNEIKTRNNEILDIHSYGNSAYIKRQKWANSREFVLSCIGWSVGFGNIWRFPYLAYKNGGGAFLLPYFILLILIGKPMYFLEVAIGQFCNLGPFSVWKCFPLAKGIGVAMIIVTFIISISYNVLMAYTLYFLAQSFRSAIPWSGCFEWWGADDSCYIRNSNQVACNHVLNKSLCSEFNNLSNASIINCTNATQSAAEQFWERYVLQLSPSINEIGYVKWDLALFLLGAWVIVFLCLMKGVKSSGKYFHI